MSLPVAILAGGLATRLHPITETIPKSLVDVGGRPFAERQLALLRSHGVTDVVFLAGHLGGMLRDTLGDGGRWGMRVRYVFDGPRQLGTGGAVGRALPELGDPFLVLYGDSYLECDYAAVARAFLASGKSALMTVCRNDEAFDLATLYQRLLAAGDLAAYEVAGRFYEIGSTEGLEETRAYLAAQGTTRQ